jgi:hypothetical protein
MTIGSKSASSYYFSSPPLQTSSSILLSTTTDTSISTTGNKRPNEDNSLQNSTIIDTKLVKVKKMKLENNVIARAIDLYNTSTVPEGNIHGNKKDIIRQQRLAAGALKKIYIYFKKREGSKWRKRTLHELNEAIVHLVKFRKLAKIDHASLAQNISKAIDYVSKAWEQELHEKTLKNQELWDRLTACRNKFQMYQKSLQDPLSELTMSKKNKKQTQLPATPVYVSLIFL